MTIRQIIPELRQQGYNVTYKTRRDGGVLITSINGERFKGAKGNIRARLLTGHVLNKRREAQLTKITRERVLHPRKIPVETPLDMESYRKRVMRKWRKAGLTGSISKKNLRRIIEDRGFEGAKTYLEEMERHTEGKAYYSAINGLLARMEEDIQTLKANGDNESADWIQQAHDLIDSKKDEFRQEWLFAIFDYLYEFENPASNVSAHDFYLRVKSILS